MPMFECCIQTSATLAAKGHQGKSFSGCGGANEYVQLYAPIHFEHLKLRKNLEI